MQEQKGKAVEIPVGRVSLSVLRPCEPSSLPPRCSTSSKRGSQPAIEGGDNNGYTQESKGHNVMYDKGNGLRVPPRNRMSLLNLRENLQTSTVHKYL